MGSINSCIRSCFAQACTSLGCLTSFTKGVLPVHVKMGANQRVCDSTVDKTLSLRHVPELGDVLFTEVVSPQCVDFCDMLL